MKIIAKDNDAWEYIQGKLHEPLENAFATAKNKYKKGELKVKKIIVDGLQDHLLIYVGNLNKYNEMYDKLFKMYEVKNLKEIISLKDQLKYMNMKKG